MKQRRKQEPHTGKVVLNLVLIVCIILPASVLGVWGGIRLHTSVFPIDPDVQMPFFPQAVALIALVLIGLLLGGLIGGFIWAAIAKQFMTRDEVYQQANYGVRIPVVSSLNKAYLRWLFRNEGRRR